MATIPQNLIDAAMQRLANDPDITDIDYSKTQFALGLQAGVDKLLSTATENGIIDQANAANPGYSFPSTPTNNIESKILKEIYIETARQKQAGIA